MGYVNFMDVQDYCDSLSDILQINVDLIKKIVYPTMVLMKNGVINEADGIDYIESSVGELVELAEGLKPYQTTIILPQKQLNVAL